MFSPNALLRLWEKPDGPCGQTALSYIPRKIRLLGMRDESLPTSLLHCWHLAAVTVGKDGRRTSVLLRLLAERSAMSPNLQCCYHRPGARSNWLAEPTMQLTKRDGHVDIGI
jgi:hypothetical protein